MSNGQLSAHHRDHVAQIGAMSDGCEKRKVLLINGVPIGALHFRIVEIFALDPPCLAIYVGPFGTRIDTHLESGHIQWTVSNFWRDRAHGSNDSPAVTAGLIEKLLF